MGSILHNALAIGLLVCSVTVAELIPSTTEIKTLSDKDIRWEEVSSRLIEEVKNHKSSNWTPRANSTNASSAICGKMITQRINVSSTKWILITNWTSSVATKIRDGKTDESTDKKENSDTKKKKKKKGNKARSGMARIVSRNISVDKLMLGSGTRSHITPDVTTMKNPISINITIKMADNTNMKATSKGLRSLNWKTYEGDIVLHLFNTCCTHHRLLWVYCR